MRCSMDVFMIGNGLDLHYCLPTTYTSFLRTVENLNNRIAAGEIITSVAQVLKNEELHNSDWALKSCFNRYKFEYDAALDPDELQRAFGAASANVWFSYLLHSFGEGKSWIDFEREINQVIQIIASSFENTYEEENEHGPSLDDIYVCVSEEDRRTNHILSHFPLFYEGSLLEGLYNSLPAKLYLVQRKYLAENPFGSGAYSLNKTAIASDIYKSLRELADMLSAYLLMFVDRPVENLVKSGKIEIDPMLLNWNWKETEIVSFNYTHTLRSLYGVNSKSLHYIHGELEAASKAGIILGINSNSDDEIEHADTTFVQFKKYYQRVFYQTDLSYIHFLESRETRFGDIDYFNLYVIGHSLDETDREVICDCFKRAASICIFYHSESEVSDKIRNLVSIFGKHEFDILRMKKNLRFFSIDRLQERNPFQKEDLTPPSAVGL